MHGRGNKLKWSMLLTLILGVFMLGGTSAFADEPIELYTPFTNLSVTPGQSVNYLVEVINQTDHIQKVGLAVEGLPADWKYELKSSSWNVQEISIKGKETGSVNITLDVPLAVDKGTYHFRVVSDKGQPLPITIQVTEQGTFQTEFTTKQANLEGATDSNFTYTTQLKNRTAEKQTYALNSGAPRGWDIQFKVGGNNVSSVVIEAGASESVIVSVTPATTVTADSYKIPIEAVSGSTTAQLELEAVIKGSYKLELTTPTGLISSDITAGDEKNIDLLVRNIGTSDLTDIELTASTPVDWEVTFDNKDITELKAGESKTIVATMKASGKAIAGDYVVSMNAKSPEATSSSQFRVAVKTSVLWGWLGILIIAAVFGAIYYLFRKYGRR
jgi:uncharacterized membrane protein